MIAGYRRRRGWATWHSAALARGSFEDGFPGLADLTGETEPLAREQSPVEMAHNFRLWAAILTKGS